MSKFIKLTDANDETTIVVSTELIGKVTCGEDDEYSTVYMTEGWDDLEVQETPEKIFSLLNKTNTPTGQSLAGNPETPPKATTQTLTADSHMENLARHA
jgi:hypothetical protein